MRFDGTRWSKKIEKRRDERGASLILALVFIVVVALVVGAIASLALNDLNNTTHFDSASSLDYAASSVADLAIESVRYAPQSQAGTPGECWNPGSGYVSQYPFNNYTVAVWCTTIENPGSSQTRVVTMYACESQLTSTSTSQAVSSAESTCASNPLLTVVESYDDYSSSGTDLCLSEPSSSTCGFGATTLAWTWGSLATATGGLILNSITITSTAPTNAVVGGHYTPTASATSNDQVVITSATPTVCSISGGVVTFLTTGQCTLNFNDPGNFNYAPASEVSQSFSIT